MNNHRVQHIAFNQFKAWDGNVRRTGADKSIEELAASIRSHGLLQPLVVKASDEGGFAVIAGRRRFLAMQRLVKDGKFKEDALIACTIVENSVNSTEISLVENIMQLPMHPADRFEAFRDLADKGIKVADIAVRFGIEETLVFKLLKLGRVSTEVMQAFRAEEIDYAQVQAFTLSDDVELQNQVLAMVINSSYRIDPSTIRTQLVKNEISATDKRVRYVGLEFYEMCGGTVRRDLFDDGNSGYVQDIALLNQLVDSKLQSEVETIKAQHWQWVEVVQEIDWKYRSQFSSLKPTLRELSAQENQELDRLFSEYEQYEEIDEEDEQLLAQKNELEQRISELQNISNEWLPEQRAISGVVVALNYDGRINIEYGLVQAENKQSSPSNKPVADNSAKPEKAEFSAALLRDLSQHRSVALRIELANNHDIAFIAVVYALVTSALYHGTAGNCLKISVSSTVLFSSAEAENIPALKAMAVKQEKLNFPENAGQLWDFLNKRSKTELDEILAYCVALSVDAVEGERRQSDIKHSQQLAKSLQLDMRKWFTATAENSFSRISRNQILQAYRETTGEEPSATLLNLKKKELAIRAEREIGDKWLPSLFRQAQSA